MTVASSTLNALQSRIIYFGHQSVGGNIMAGVTDLVSASGGAVPQVVVRSGDTVAEPGSFLHDRVGANTDVSSKIEAFSASIRDWNTGPRPHVAFFKFCYVDMQPDSDPNEIFHLYTAGMDRLERDYPEITFVHVTMPLVADRLPLMTHAKNLAKRILRRGIPVTRDLNAARFDFNELMRERYGDSGRLFDLARVESTPPAAGPNGYEALRGEYTYDGGHLNELGRRHVAAALLGFLAGLAQ